MSIDFSVNNSGRTAGESISLSNVSTKKNKITLEFPKDTKFKKFVNSDGSKASEKAEKENKTEDAWWESNGKFTVNYIRGKKIVVDKRDGAVMEEEETIARHSNGKKKISRLIRDNGNVYDTYYNKNEKPTKTIVRDKENKVVNTLKYGNNNIKIYDENNKLFATWVLENDSVTIINEKTNKTTVVKLDKPGKPKPIIA